MNMVEVMAVVVAAVVLLVQVVEGVDITFGIT